MTDERDNTTRPGREFALSVMAEQRRQKRVGLTTPPPGSMPVGSADDTGSGVYLKPDSLGRAMQVVGSSGSGKTNFLKHFIRQLLLRKRKCGWGFAVIDPHGELAEYTLDLIALMAADLADEVYYLDFRQEPVLSLNPLCRWWPGDHSRRQDLEYATADLWKEALTKAYGVRNSMNQPSIAQVLTLLGQAMVMLDLAPIHAQYFLNRGDRDKAILKGLIERLPVGETRSLWEHYAALPASAWDSSYALGPRNRLRPLTGFEQFKLMFGRADKSLDFLRLMDRGGIGIFNLALTGSSVSLDAQQLIASLLLQQFRQTFPRRTENDPATSPPFTLVLDEFGEFCAPEFARAFTAARKYNFEVVFAHQDLDQLVPEDGDKQLLNTVLAVPNKAVFGGLYIDQAELLAKQIYLQMLDPDKVQFQPQTISFWPISVKDIARAWGRSEGVARGAGDVESSSSAVSSGLAEVLQPAVGALGVSAADIARSIASSGVLSSTGQARSKFYAASQAWSESAHEVWRTEYRPFLQPGTPVFENLDTQVFRYAQAMSLRPQGHFVFYQRPDVPLYTNVTLETQKLLSDEERARFLEAVYRKDDYAERAVVRKTIEEKECRLAADVDDEPRVIRGRRGRSS